MRSTCAALCRLALLLLLLPCPFSRFPLLPVCHAHHLDLFEDIKPSDIDEAAVDKDDFGNTVPGAVVLLVPEQCVPLLLS